MKATKVPAPPPPPLPDEIVLTLSSEEAGILLTMMRANHRIPKALYDGSTCYSRPPFIQDRLIAFMDEMTRALAVAGVTP